MTNQELWQIALGEIELSISKANFITWFKNTSLISNKNGKVIINVPNAFTREWLENKYNKIILKALRNIINNIKEINYIISQSKTQESKQLRKTTKKKTKRIAYEEEGV